MRRGVSIPDFSGEADVLIESLGHQGDGVARVGDRQIFVPLTAPGDRARIAFGGARGRMLDLIAPGPDRVSAPCPHFGACGGCVLQHVAPNAYVRFKREVLVTTLAQRGFTNPPLADPVVLPAATRRRATFAFRQPDLGFYRAGTRAVLDLQTCLVLTPGLETALPALRSLLPDGSAGRMHVTATEVGLDVDLALTAGRADEVRLARAARACDLARFTLDGAPVIVQRPPTVSFAGIAVKLPPRAFLQPSREGEAELQAWVKDGVGGARRVCDLFAGLGTFALPLALSAQVHAVDSDDELLAALSQAARTTPGLKPLTVETRDLLRNPLPVKALAAFDAVVFDPPRAGARGQTEAIAAAKVPRVVAVSCSAATFARDARLLVDAGYCLQWVRPLDQFIWSAHIELVALFTRDRKP